MDSRDWGAEGYINLSHGRCTSYLHPDQSGTSCHLSASRKDQQRGDQKAAWSKINSWESDTTSTHSHDRRAAAESKPRISRLYQQSHNPQSDSLVPPCRRQQVSFSVFCFYWSHWAGMVRDGSQTSMNQNSPKGEFSSAVSGQMLFYNRLTVNFQLKLFNQMNWMWNCSFCFTLRPQRRHPSS